MKKLLGIVILGLMLQGCDRVSDKIKEFCGVKEDVLNAKTDQAAKYDKVDRQTANSDEEDIC